MNLLYMMAQTYYTQHLLIVILQGCGHRDKKKMKYAEVNSIPELEAVPWTL